MQRTACTGAPPSSRELEPRLAEAELDRQVAIRAQGLHVELRISPVNVALLRVHDRQEALAAQVVGARAGRRCCCDASRGRRCTCSTRERRSAIVRGPSNRTAGSRRCFRRRTRYPTPGRREDLEIHRPTAVRHDVMLGVAGGDVDAIERLGNRFMTGVQLRRNCAASSAFSRSGGLRSRAAGSRPRCRRQRKRLAESLDGEEQEALREREVFLQQPITLEAASGRPAAAPRCPRTRPRDRCAPAAGRARARPAATHRERRCSSPAPARRSCRRGRGSPR